MNTSAFLGLVNIAESSGVVTDATPSLGSVHNKHKIITRERMPVDTIRFASIPRRWPIGSHGIFPRRNDFQVFWAYATLYATPVIQLVIGWDGGDQSLKKPAMCRYSPIKGLDPELAISPSGASGPEPTSICNEDFGKEALEIVREIVTPAPHQALAKTTRAAIAQSALREPQLSTAWCFANRAGWLARRIRRARALQPDGVHGAHPMPARLHTAPINRTGFRNHWITSGA